MQLPIDTLLPEIVRRIEVSTVTILHAEPGAGKTTRVPPAILRSGGRPVFVLEPRRIAARLAARRVADESGTKLGDLVGYQVRWEKVGSERTRLWYLTEGILTQRLLSGDELSPNSAVILDEFHERHLETDLALALLLRLRDNRKDLRLVLMSATLQAEKLSEQLGNAPVIRASGRTFPVDVSYTPASSLPLEEQVSSAVQSAAKRTAGHILVFLPGAAEIRNAIRSCEGLGRTLEARLLPLHGDLSIEEQELAVAPSDDRKIIFATNVAESSITIGGVDAVVDSGLARVLAYSPWTGFSSLQLERITQSSAIQRAGRAGRTGPGTAMRLYSETDFVRRPMDTSPEIIRAELSQLLLQLAGAHLRIEELQWLDPPPGLHIDASRALLNLLRALEKGDSLTRLGLRMAAMPVHPRLARLVMEATRMGVRDEGCKLAAILSDGRSAGGFERNGRASSDLDVLLSGDLSWTARRALTQLKALTRDGQVEPAQHDTHALEKSVLSAFGDRVVKKRGADLLLCGGGSAQLSRDSILPTEFAVALDVEGRSDRPVPLVRLAVPIEPDWLLDFFPEKVEGEEALVWNRQSERVEQVNALRYQQLVIDETRSIPRDSKAASRLLAEKALESGWERFADGENTKVLLDRIKFASGRTDKFPKGDELLLRALNDLAEGLTSFAELRQATANGGFAGAILSQLDVRLLDKIAPEFVTLPRGRRVRIDYSEGQPPSISSRLQDFFGMKQTPTIAEGAVPLVVKLLAPNHRPVQVTTDLVSFWKNLYPQMRRELGRRYPKHAWPDTPE